MKSCENCKHRYGSGGEHPCNTCIYTDHGQPTSWEAGPNYVPVTNADRIRAMSDEELEKFLRQVELAGIDYGVTFCDMCNGNKNNNTLSLDCDGCLLCWLRQPAEEK